MKHILQATIISFILLLTSVYGNNDSSIETPQIITPLEKELLKKSTEILYSWDKSESHTNYFFSLYDKGLKKIVYVKKQLIAEDICEGSICSYKPDVILTDDKMHRWYLRAYNDKESTSTIFTDFYV
jgi:hypothetical protein